MSRIVSVLSMAAVILMALNTCVLGQSGQMVFQSIGHHKIPVVVLYKKPSGQLTQAQIQVSSIEVDSAGKIKNLTGLVKSMSWLFGKTTKILKSRLSNGRLLLTTANHHVYVIYDLKSSMYGKMKDASIPSHTSTKRTRAAGIHKKIQRGLSKLEKAERCRMQNKQ